MRSLDLVWVLVAAALLARNGLAAARLLRAPAGRARAVVPLLTCLLALAVLALIARGALLAPAGAPGGPP